MIAPSSKGIITAAQTTGPASGPLPTSSTPAIYFTPFSCKARSIFNFSSAFQIFFIALPSEIGVIGGFFKRDLADTALSKIVDQGFRTALVIEFATP